MRYEDRAKILFKVADLMDERADDDFAIREAMGKDEAIRLANDTDYGLASGIQTSDLGRALRIAGNSVYFKTLQSEAHRAGDQVGIPLAGDDPQALELAARLVRDAGFEPIVVGPLVSARSFDAGTPVYNTGMSGAQLARALGVVRSSSIPELQK
jgi:predicted dinucleotide-binding enzyme